MNTKHNYEAAAYACVLSTLSDAEMDYVRGCLTEDEIKRFGVIVVSTVVDLGSEEEANKQFLNHVSSQIKNIIKEADSEE